MQEAAYPAGAQPTDPENSVTEAQQEARAIIDDALAQAALVRSRAENAADALLADAREDAERQIEDAKAASRVLREQAEAIVATARSRAAELDETTTRERAGLAAELDAARTTHDEQLATKRREFEQRQSTEAAQAQARRDEALE